MIVIGVDTGGTFTDFIYKDDIGWHEYKLLSTPDNPARAVLEGVARIAAGSSFSMCHGSTVATNAILERKGAKVAYITNKGFEDVPEIGRQDRKRLYDLFYRRGEQLVPKERRFGIECRVDCSGEILKEPDPAEIDRIAEVISKNAESAAVCFLFSFVDNSHEKLIGEALKNKGLKVSLSHEILSEFREFERASTTIVNAYVSPIMDRYLKNLQGGLGENPLRIMQSNGGSISAETAGTESVRTILSGPAGGAVGAFEIGRQSGFDRLITFDMGGTSTDVALIDGCLPLTTESEVDHLPVKVPMIDIHTVGAGGGSIAWLDSGGALQVGPESAGADPGPICYGKGERITVTDANLYLGRLLPDMFLGGGMTLDFDRLNRYFDEMAHKIGVSPVELAEGVIDVANASMEKALKVISVEKGFDPSLFVLFSFGGAGGLHACDLAKNLNISKVFIPVRPGILSAVGMLFADIIKDYSVTHMLSADELSFVEVDELFAPVMNTAEEQMLAEGCDGGEIEYNKFVDMRYKGQSYELIVPFEDDFIKAFHEAHAKTYGYCDEKRAVELVNIRLRAVGVAEKPQLTEIQQGNVNPLPSAHIGSREVIFGGQKHETDIYAREELLAGNNIEGPAIITEYTSTIVIPPACSAVVDKFGSLVVDISSKDFGGDDGR